jgi:hypothetical protein
MVYELCCFLRTGVRGLSLSEGSGIVGGDGNGSRHNAAVTGGTTAWEYTS